MKFWCLHFGVLLSKLLKFHLCQLQSVYALSSLVVHGGSFWQSLFSGIPGSKGGGTTGATGAIAPLKFSPPNIFSVQYCRVY